MKALSHSRQTNRLQEAYEFKNINKSEHQIKLAIKDVEKKARLKANRDKPLEYVQLSLNRIMLTKVLGRGKLEKEHQAAWKKLKKEYNLKESVNEAKDNLYLQLHKKYADQIKGLKAKKIKKLTDLVSVQRWTMEDEYDNSGFDRKAMSKQFDHERKLFKQYMAGDKTVSLKELDVRKVHGDKRIENPKTGNKVKLRTALKGKKGSKVYQTAKKIYNRLKDGE